MNLKMLVNIFAIVTISTILSCQEGEGTWQQHWEKSELFIQMREFSSAEKELKKALVEAERLDEQVARLSQTLTRLAAVYDAQSKWLQAEPLLERALKLNEQILGVNHPDIATSLRNLGALYHVQHKFDQGRPLFQRALRIHERHLRPEHPAIIADLKNIVGLHLSKVLFQKAAPFLTRTLANNQRLEGEAEEIALQGHDDFSKLYTAQSQFEKAKPYLNQAIDRDKKGWGFQNYRIIGSVHNVAYALSTPDKMRHAESLLLRELQEAKKMNDPLQLEESLTVLIAYFRMQHRFVEAIDLLTQKRQAVERRIGPRNQEVVLVLGDLAILHQLNHQNNDAERLYKEALAIGMNALGEDHEIVTRIREQFERSFNMASLTE